MVWRFASPPPETNSEFEVDGQIITLVMPELCPELAAGHTNGDLYTFYVRCRARFEAAIARIELYDNWVAIEREAHAELQGASNGNR